MTKLPSYIPLPEETMEAQIVRARSLDEINRYPHRPFRGSTRDMAEASEIIVDGRVIKSRDRDLDERQGAVDADNYALADMQRLSEAMDNNDKPALDGVYRWKRPATMVRMETNEELAARQGGVEQLLNLGGFGYAPEPYVAPTSGLSVLLMGMALGGALASALWLAAILGGII